MAKSKRGFSFELRNSRQNRAFCVSKRVGKPLGCSKFKAKRDGLGFSFESCRGELGAFALAKGWGSL
ncbi:hypothetical protein CYI55_06850 [Campylobacter upsaliensis]|nr:hypothetical protein [Campylobacter upsaliensis]EAK4236157.1 hypothetical protein [Campylobacter upsaliensis]